MLRHQAYEAYKEAMHYDLLSADEKVRTEFTKLKEIVAYAYQHVPYYHELYARNQFHPSMLKEPSDWQLVPILEKDTLRYHPELVVSDEYNVKDLAITTTSGSTGTPLKVYKDPNIHMEVMGWRGLSWWGIDPSANMAKLHRKAAKTLFQKLKNESQWWPTKRAYLNASMALTDSALEKFVADLNRKKIVWMQGYCSLLESVADYIIKNKKEITSLQMVWCTSAPLFSSVRMKMEEAFRCKIMDQYGCNEMWNIAIQKKEEPFLTVASDFVHIDTINSKNQQTDINEDGDILITDLNCKAFPLIKYRLGDKGSFAQTPFYSKDGYPKLNFVKGRISDNIVLPSGKIVDGVYLTAICDNYPDIIDAYQVCQHEDYTVTLKLVIKNREEKYQNKLLELEECLNESLNGELKCQLQIVERIPDVKGKKRYIISDLTTKKDENRNHTTSSANI